MDLLHIISILFTLLSFHTKHSLCDGQYYTVRFENYRFSSSYLEVYKELAETSIRRNGGRIVVQFEDGFRCTATKKGIDDLHGIFSKLFQRPGYGLPTVTLDPYQSDPRAEPLPNRLQPNHPMREEQRAEAAELPRTLEEKWLQHPQFRGAPKPNTVQEAVAAVQNSPGIQKWFQDQHFDDQGHV